MLSLVGVRSSDDSLNKIVKAPCVRHNSETIPNRVEVEYYTGGLFNTNELNLLKAYISVGPFYNI